MPEINRDSFQSIEELTKWADDGHLSRVDLQVIYDSLPGVPPLKRLRNRPAAIERIWAERERFPEAPKPVVEATETVTPAGDRGATKALIVCMIVAGSTLKELTGATGWQPHTMRGYISTLKSKGMPIVASKEDGVTVYRTGAVGA